MFEFVEDLFDEVNPIAFAICWGVSMLILFYLRGAWKETSLEMGIPSMIFFGLILMVPSYFILLYYHRKD